MATDILTKTEEYGKARTAFEIALANAATAREQTLLSLGADVSNMSGTVLTPKDAGALFGPETGKTTKDVTLTTGFGEGTLPSLTKEGTTTTYENVTGLTERGVGTTSGLSQQARLASTDTTALAKQAAIQEAQAALTEANAGTIGAKAEELAARAALDTAKGRRRNVGGKVGGIMKATNRGGYTTKSTPLGAVPKKPKAGQVFTGKGGVKSVYRTKGPKGAGWYKKG